MSGYRCEVPGCRGNRPCPACLVGLSSAIQSALEAMLRGADKGTANAVMKAIRRELDAYWAKTIGDVRLPAKVGAGLTRVKKTTTRSKRKREKRK